MFFYLEMNHCDSDVCPPNSHCYVEASSIKGYICECFSGFDKRGDECIGEI